MRKGALEQSRYFVHEQLGDPQLTVADLQEELARGDTSFTNKLLYFGANLHRTVLASRIAFIFYDWKLCHVLLSSTQKTT